jgi:hypothetical protein
VNEVFNPVSVEPTSVARPKAEWMPRPATMRIVTQPMHQPAPSSMPAQAEIIAKNSVKRIKIDETTNDRSKT